MRKPRIPAKWRPSIQLVVWGVRISMFMTRLSERVWKVEERFLD